MVATRTARIIMSTPVVTEKWAGTYDCSVCRRKRLTASEFSKKAIEKHRKEPEAPMKCKSCVEEAAQKERDAAASKAASSAAVAGSSSADAGATEHECSACKKSLPAAAFSRSNLSKGPGKQRCSECVAEAEKANVNAGDKAYNEKLAAAKAAAAKAEATGTAAEKLATSRERVEMGPLWHGRASARPHCHGSEHTPAARRFEGCSHRGGEGDRAEAGRSRAGRARPPRRPFRPGW